MPHYLLRLNAPRPSFPHDASEAELAAMAEHAGYWQARADEGAAIAVGPVMDPAGAWGLAIVAAGSVADAQALGDADPIAAAGLGFSYEAFPLGGIILPKG